MDDQRFTPLEGVSPEKRPGVGSTGGRAATHLPTLSPLAQDGLKLLATVAMVADHLGVFIFPDALALRVIGRFAMPAFALMLGYNLARRGTPPVRYFAPLVGFGLLAQPAYALASGGWFGNILFSFALGVAAVVSLRCLAHRPFALRLSLLGLGMISLFTDYPVAAAALVVCSERLWRQFDALNLLGWIGFALAANAFTPQAVVGLLPLIAVVALARLDGPRLLPRRFGHVFYPLHLSLLALIGAVLDRSPLG